MICFINAGCLTQLPKYEQPVATEMFFPWLASYWLRKGEVSLRSCVIFTSLVEISSSTRASEMVVGVYAYKTDLSPTHSSVS